MGLTSQLGLTSRRLRRSFCQSRKAVRAIRRYVVDASADATLSEHACVVANRSRDTWAFAQEGAFNISAFRTTDIIETVHDTLVHLVSLVCFGDQRGVHTACVSAANEAAAVLSRLYCVSYSLTFLH